MLLGAFMFGPKPVMSMAISQPMLANLLKAKVTGEARPSIVKYSGITCSAPAQDRTGFVQASNASVAKPPTS